MSFYPTEIQSVGNGVATDVQGKTLRFMGNLPCQAGDTVWTDGKFIFGNSTPKPAPLLDDIQSGTPVLFDKEKSDNDKGYLRAHGKFKKYKRMKDHEWIVNDYEKYKYGKEEDLIDAEIDNNGDLWTVTDGFYRFKSAPTFHNHLFTQAHIQPNENSTAFSVFSRVTPFVGQLFDYPNQSFADIPAENSDVVFYKNDEEQFTVNLKQFADIVEDFALEAKNKIMEKSNKEDDAVNWTMQPAPPDSAVALSYASVVSFNIDQNHNWDAIISTAAMGFCFPYLTFNGSVFNKAFPNGEDKIFSETLITCINTFEDLVFEQQALPYKPDIAPYPPFTGEEKDDNDEYTPEYKSYLTGKVNHYAPYYQTTDPNEDLSYINAFETVLFEPQNLHFNANFEKYPEFEGDETDENDEYTPEYKKYILDKVKYYIPKARFKYYYWFPIVFSACKVLRVHNGEVTDTIYKSKGGGNIVYAPDDWDEKGDKDVAKEPYDDFVYNYEQFNEQEIDFPLDGFSYHCENFFVENVFEGEKQISIPEDVYNSLANSIECYSAYGKYEGYYFSNVDSTAALIATQTNADINNLYGRQIFTPALYYEYSGLGEGYNDNPLKVNYPCMNGWFKKPYEDNDDVNISYVFAKFKRNKFALGIRGGDLYRISLDGIYEKVGTGLKNFRLRELKNIRKAK